MMQSFRNHYRLYISLTVTIFLFIIDVNGLGAGQVVVGYYRSWARNEYPAARIQTENLTHVCHAFAWPEPTGSISAYDDINDLNLISMLNHADKKILISMGGWGNSYGFTAMSNSPIARKKFIDELIVSFINIGYDGIDIDWEHPSSFTDRNNLNLLIKEIRQEFDNLDPSLLITMAVPAGSWTGQWIDYTFLKDYVDWFGCMTYDFHGDYSDHSGHNSPLFSSAKDNCGSVDTAYDYLVNQRGLPQNKVLIGIPFYGKEFGTNRLYAPYTGNVVSHNYAYIDGLIGNGWTRYWDNESHVPFLLDNFMTKLITYDDSLSVRLKCQYAQTKGLRGVIIWALGQDMIDERQPLLETIGATFAGNIGVDSKVNNLQSYDLDISNYPNPFNSATTIAFTIPKSQRVILEIYDIMGCRKDVLVDSYFNQGRHKINYDATGLPTGIYFSKLIIENNIKINKLIHLK